MTDWSALSARIRGLVQAGEFHARLLTINTSDSYGRWRSLRKQSGEILGALRQLRATYGANLPPAAVVCIDDFINERASLIGSGIDPTMGPEATTAGLTFLAALETELSFLLAGTQEVIRARSERAFVHLQRAIVADSEIQTKWKAAFTAGETRCEQLGAVHLLSHGIFAFKVSGEGERTDLVFNDVADASDEIQRYAEGMVLTEWKVANVGNWRTKLEQAHRQAQRYGRGVLGGLELTAYRYLVLVTEDYVPDFPREISDDLVIYRPVNIAVAPRNPSARPRVRQIVGEKR